MNIIKNKLSHIIFIFITLASLTIVISCSSEEKIVVPKYCCPIKTQNHVLGSVTCSK